MRQNLLQRAGRQSCLIALAPTPRGSVVAVVSWSTPQGFAACHFGPLLAFSRTSNCRISQRPA
ncbi:hypothetical protein BC567DRAFT_238817 [Phyllosticta citribraziliensis]